MTDLLPEQPVCAADAGTWCARFYEWTNNDFLARSADAIVGGTVEIAFILAVRAALSSGCWWTKENGGALVRRRRFFW